MPLTGGPNTITFEFEFIFTTIILHFSDTNMYRKKTVAWKAGKKLRFETQLDWPLLPAKQGGKVTALKNIIHVIKYNACYNTHKSPFIH